MHEQGGHTNAPHSRSLQELAEGGVFDGGEFHPPKYREVEDSGGPDDIHVAAQGDTNIAGLVNYFPHPNGKHRHPGVRLSR